MRSVRCVGVSSGQLLSDNDCSAEDMPVSRSTCGDDEYTVI